MTISLTGSTLQSQRRVGARLEVTSCLRHEEDVPLCAPLVLVCWVLQSAVAGLWPLDLHLFEPPKASICQPTTPCQPPFFHELQFFLHASPQPDAFVSAVLTAVFSKLCARRVKATSLSIWTPIVIVGVFCALVSSLQSCCALLQLAGSSALCWIITAMSLTVTVATHKCHTFSGQHKLTFLDSLKILGPCRKSLVGAHDVCECHCE